MARTPKASVAPVEETLEEQVVEDVVETAEEAPEVAPVDATSATVTWNGGARTYSLADHGELFRELAAEFAGKVEGTVA